MGRYHNPGRDSISIFADLFLEFQGKNIFSCSTSYSKLKYEFSLLCMWILKLIKVPTRNQ